MESEIVDPWVGGVDPRVGKLDPRVRERGSWVGNRDPRVQLPLGRGG